MLEKYSFVLTLFFLFSNLGKFRWGEKDECHLHYQYCKETWMLNIFASWRHNWGICSSIRSFVGSSTAVNKVSQFGSRVFIFFFQLFQVNQKMILTLTASIMHWFMKQPVEEKASGISDSENGSQSETISNSTLDDSASDSSIEENGNI